MKLKNVLCVVLTVILAAGALLGVSACSYSDDGKMKVAVTIVPLAGFVKAVCGDKVDVVTMIPAGYSPETYEPTPKQMIEFSKAAVCFAVGVPAETAMLTDAEPAVIRLQDIVAENYPDRYFAEGSRDPHIWLSVKRVKIIISAIAEYMSETDPQNAEFYNQNAADYIAQLDEVDRELTQAVSEMKSKTFIAFHPAFGYLADDYGLTMYALEEEGKEATVEHLQEMIDLAKAEGIKAIFYQEEIDSKQAQAFAEEIGGKTVMLSPLAENYIENILLMVNTIKEANNLNG